MRGDGTAGVNRPVVGATGVAELPPLPPLSPAPPPPPPPPPLLRQARFSASTSVGTCREQRDV